MLCRHKAVLCTINLKERDNEQRGGGGKGEKGGERGEGKRGGGGGENREGEGEYPCFVKLGELNGSAHVSLVQDIHCSVHIAGVYEFMPGHVHYFMLFYFLLGLFPSPPSSPLSLSPALPLLSSLSYSTPLLFPSSLYHFIAHHSAEIVRCRYDRGWLGGQVEHQS